MADTFFPSTQVFVPFGQFAFWYALLLGLVVGSFLNVVIYRLPRVLFGNASSLNEEIESQNFFGNLKCLVHPGSMTPCCQHSIAWSDNIPLFSWLRLKGKCRYCHASISPRYILVELLTGLGFALVYMEFGMTWATPLYCLFLGLLIALFSLT